MIVQNKRHWLLPVTLMLLVTLAESGLAQQKLRVFVLAGQSNMVGHARAHTAATLLHSDDARDQRLAKLIFGTDSVVSREMLEAQLVAARALDQLTGGISNSKVKALPPGPEKTELEGKVAERKSAHEAYQQRIRSACVASDRVYIHSIADRNTRSGKLGVGFGADQKKIGPEYGFGLSLASKFEGPILLIKTSWGGKSLHYDFRPPSAGPYTLTEKEEAGGKSDLIRNNAGRFYRNMKEIVDEVLKDPGKYHPDYDPAAGYEMAGFVWFQGFNDQFSPVFRDQYQANLISLIKDVRRDFQNPKLPVVVGVLGTGVTAEKIAENAVSVAQREVVNSLKDARVAGVESYLHYSHFSHEVFKKGWPEHYYEWDTVGSDRPYHYLGSGAFFVRLGDAFAQAMDGLIH